MKVPPVILAGAALGALVVLYLRSADSIGQAVGQAAVGAVGVAGDATAEVIMSAGEAIGIPRTDADKCAAAKARGDWWEASFACPVGDLFSGWGVGSSSGPSDESLYASWGA